ncbi:G-protein coupled receptor family C group 5 member C-like [Ambystoma mexicanum]|uniref:G-protein coupled receptor family C group 5 member C-like n=1 Tax=Ambystoma mexicanum TaxID=8296 RepID=UPI0037E82C54
MPHWTWHLLVLVWSSVSTMALKSGSHTAFVPKPLQNPASPLETSRHGVPVAPTGSNFSTVPPGCSPGVHSIYFRLCDLELAWGIALEAVAVLGILCTISLGMVFLSFRPLLMVDQWRGVMVLNFVFLLGVLGLFSLVFAFVVEQHEVNCSVRRFLFGVLFSLCFSCLAAHAVHLNYLTWRNRGPQSSAVFLLAACLFLVETVINIEWLIITNLRHDALAPDQPGNPCNIAKMDFVMALVYVMFLMAGTVAGACSVLCGNYRKWKRHGVYILGTTIISVIIWVVWVVMYLYGNAKSGSEPTWDDPVLAIALACNGWTFLVFYFLPELVEMVKPVYHYKADRRSGDYWSNQQPPSFIFDNKAFSMGGDDPREQWEERGARGNPFGNFGAQVHVLPSYVSTEFLYPEAVTHFHLPHA